PPGNVKGSELTNEMVLDGTVKYRLVHLTFGPQERLFLDVGLFTRTQGGPFPAIIYQTGSPPDAKPQSRLPPGPNQGRGEDVLLLVGPAKQSTNLSRGSNDPQRNGFFGGGTADEMARRYKDVFSRGYALIVYNPNDCAEDTTLRNGDGSWAFPNTRFFP